MEVSKDGQFDVIKYATSGTCSKMIFVKVKDGVVEDLGFVGGCPGNLQGISHLAKGMNIDDLIARLEGIKCGAKDTSCPDQLAKCLSEYKLGKFTAV